MLAPENALENSHGHNKKSTASVSAAPPKQCDECRQETALYQCPRCQFRSCSLACCKAHKDRLGCNGKRDRTSYVREMTDDILQSDYHFLEDVLGTVDSSKRLLRQVGAMSTTPQQNRSRKRARGGVESDELSTSVQSPSPHTLLQIEENGPMELLASTCVGNSSLSCPINGKWRNFQKQAASKGIQVVYMPVGMERHKSNRSYVKHNTMHWTVEWILYTVSNEQPSRRAAITTPAVSEKECLWTALPRESLWGTVDSSSFHLLIKRRPCPAHQPAFVELCDSATLASALTNTTVIEFPTIHVVHVDRLNEFPRAIVDGGVEKVEATTEVESAAPLPSVIPVAPEAT